MSEFRPSSYQIPVQDLVKEYETWDKEQHYIEQRTEPDPLSLKMVREGRLNPDTGAVQGMSSKAKKILMFNPSEWYKLEHERIFGS